jgi:hypothetical protein
LMFRSNIDEIGTMITDSISIELNLWIGRVHDTAITKLIHYRDTHKS